MQRPRTFPDRQHKVALALTRALLAGNGDVPGMRARSARALGRDWPWLGALCKKVAEHFGAVMALADHDEVLRTILAFAPFSEAFQGAHPHPEVRGHFPFHEPMGTPPLALAGINLPQLPTPGDLARWLQLSAGELEWFADPFGNGGRHVGEALRHYRCRWLEKSGGGARLLEIPKPRLRAIQRQILRQILDRVPTHPAAHGCVASRSTLSAATPHAAHALLLRLDLEDFFGSISAARVRALFRNLGYPPQSARYLAALTTHCVPASMARGVPVGPYASPEDRRRIRDSALRVTERHLPQGAPSSAAIANLCAYRLDLRLAGAAQACDARYTRYVDDLFFSSDDLSPARWRRFALMAYTIVMEEGFTPNVRKTRFSTQAQAQFVTGLVVNAHLNLPRREFDRIKALLTNCVRHGPVSQNRDGHPQFRARLLGLVARVEQINPPRGAKLRALFDAIQWN